MNHVNLILISIMVFIIKCDAGELNATDNPRIIFTGLSSSTQEEALNYTVVAYKPLHLHFQNMSHGWCYYSYHHNPIMDEWDRGVPKLIDSTFSIVNVTHDFSTQLKCKVGNYNNKLSNFHYYFLNLHVKGAKSVEIAVNGKELTFSEADLSVPYDGNTVYFYEDGKHVQIVCRNTYETGSVLLEYFTKDATNISDSATFFIQLHPGSNGSYIDCVYNTAEPPDTFLYRVTFVTKKRLFNLTENVHISVYQDKGSDSLSPILGTSIGALLIILGLTGAACWYVKSRNAKHIETPYVDMSNHNDSSTPQCTNECENQYDLCYSENLSIRETYRETPDSVENKKDPEDHYYTKVDYFRCKPKIGETQTRNSKIYDEPYVQITMSVGM